MKVIIFTHNYIDDNSGGSFASRAFVNAFSEIADSCMLIYPDRGNPIRNFIHKNCILNGVTNNKSKIEKIVDVYRGHIHRYMDVAISLIKNFNPDTVVFDTSVCSAGLLKIVKKMDKKVITIHHNYQVEYFQGTKPFIAWRIPFMNYIREAERIAVQFSDLNLTLTDQDIDLLQIHYNPHKTAKIIKWGCFEPTTIPILEYKTINNNNCVQNHKLCFAITGSLSTYQTEISVVPFLKNLYPELLKRLPESTLIIAGSNPSKKIKKACAKYPSIRLIPNPTNMKDVIALADIYICPTCVGGGLKLRVMDGLKVGLPVLTHAVSARGYDEFKKTNCLFVYENKDSFMNNLDIVLAEKQKGNLDKEKIINLYNSFFSFESGVKRLKEILSNSGIN